MSLLALGLNHLTAPVAIRERAAIGNEQLNEALLALKNVNTVTEAAIVSTCNRTEIYCGMSHVGSEPVIQWLHRFLKMQHAHFTPYLFQHSDHDVVRHLMRVCSGLDSMVIGEPQILGQIKQAYRDAAAIGTVGPELSPLFQSAFSVAKQVRTDTTIGHSSVSVAFTAVSLARQVFADLSKHTALLIGAGETIQLAARHLQSNKIGKLLIANRTVQRAATLTQEVGGEALALEDLATALPEADIIISSTGSPLPILGKGAIESALRARRYRTMLIIDIAVPRDVEPQVGDLDNVFLYTIDDLHSVIDENRQSRKNAANQAEQIVSNQAELFMRKRRALGANDTIRAYRDATQKISSELVEKSLRKLASGQNPEAVLQQLAHSLTNKMMHTPTTRLRQAAEQDDTDLIDAAKSLFDLDRKNQ